MTTTALKARYSGWCGKCQAKYGEGTPIIKVNGKWAHETCPKGAKPDTQVYATAPPRDMARANRKADECWRCGSWVEAGAGTLIYCVEDSGCPVHHDHGGYHVECRDRDACNAARADAKAKRSAAVQVAKAKQDTIAAFLRVIKVAKNGDPMRTRAEGPVERTIAIGSRMAGSETIYVYAKMVRYCESSYDGGYDWTMDRSVELDALVDGVSAVVGGVK